MTEQRPRASIYIRLSRASTETNLSRAGMERDLRALAARLGADVAAVHVDDGLSGAIRNRPAFVEWLDDAREGRADILAAWSIDRMTREGLAAAALILDVIEASSVRLVDTQGVDSAGDKSAFRLLFVIKAELARAELESMRARAQARAHRAGEARQWRGGVPPFGYAPARRADGAPTLQIVDSEAEVIRDAARRIIQGAPVQSVARDLNAGPVPTRNGGQWTATSLLKVLRSPTTRGLYTDGSSHKSGTRTGKAATTPEGAPVRADWPAILDPATALQFDTVLATRRTNGGTPGRRFDSRILSGLLRCGTCGGTLRVGLHRGRYRYSCFAAAGKCAHRVSVDALDIETVVYDAVIAERRGAVMMRNVPAVDANATLIADLTAQRATLAQRVTLDPTDANVAALRACIAQLDEATHAAPTQEWELVPTGQTIGDMWDAADDAERCRFLASFGAGPITVQPATRRRQPASERIIVP